jgi:glycerol-3-phosphate cytidylyltransferase
MSEESKTSGIIAGVWDLLHPGHIETLNFCKANCDELWVAIQTDPTIDRPHKNKPIQTIYERCVQLTGLNCVDHISVYETEQDLENMLASGDYDFMFVGEDHRNDIITGLEMNNKIDAAGYKSFNLVFVPRFHSYSTTELRGRIIKDYHKTVFQGKNE